jgi:hypothetical protein
MALEHNSSVPADIRVIDEEDEIVELEVGTPYGLVTILTAIRMDGNTLVLYNFHIDGPGPHIVGLAYLRRLADQVIAENDVDALEIQGFERSTGATRGRVPSPLRFRRR